MAIILTVMVYPPDGDSYWGVQPAGLGKTINAISGCIGENFGTNIIIFNMI